MKAVMYGGGNIGRGFIGMLLSQSGYDVTFVDVVDAVVNRLNEEHCYPVRIISSEGHEDVQVEHVSAVNGNDQAATAKAIAECDIMATAVGVNILKFIISNLVAGIRLRREQGGGPLNILICENLMDANKVLEGMLKAELTEEEIGWFDENIGLVEVSIGRMVPVQTDAMKDGDPLRVCVESYGFLPADKAAFKGGVPEIKNMVPFDPFDFYIKRKLYVHNMSHATCAYLGLYTGKDYIYQSIDDADTELIVSNAMTESTMALSAKYGVPLEDLVKHTQDLLRRFTNSALMDTCKRVGGDPKRKLSPADRLIGSSRTCMEKGICPAYISVGTAGAVYEYLVENELPQTKENALEVLRTISGLSDDEELTAIVLRLYELYQSGADIRTIRLLAAKIRAEHAEAVI
ncbi:MAG: mannitol dehydrogenase [Lachnospiraceae bacterium]|nr:mannitol dehydrogenase [Lachnospiraceae bacterium]